MNAFEKYTLELAIYMWGYIIGRSFMCCAERFILHGALAGWIFTAGYVFNLALAANRGIQNARLAKAVV